MTKWYRWMGLGLRLMIFIVLAMKQDEYGAR